VTFEDFARSVRDSAEYRESVKKRAIEGRLPPDVELFLLEMADGRVPLAADAQMVDGRNPVSADRPVATGVRQGPTLALIRPSACKEEA
jgi:hypothetical protein